MIVASFRALGCFDTNFLFQIGPSNSVGFSLFLRHRVGIPEAVPLPSLQHGTISRFVSSQVSGLGTAAASRLGKNKMVVKLDLGGFFCVFSTSPSHRADHGPKAVATKALAVLRRTRRLQSSRPTPGTFPEHVYSLGLSLAQTQGTLHMCGDLTCAFGSQCHLCKLMSSRETGRFCDRLPAGS